MLSLPELWPLCSRSFQFIGKQTEEPVEGQPVPLNNSNIRGSCDDKDFRKKHLFVLSGHGISSLMNHTLVSLLLDTGATLSILNEETWKKSGQYCSISQTKQENVFDTTKIATCSLHVVPACIGTLNCYVITQISPQKQQVKVKTTTTNQQNVQSMRKFSFPTSGVLWAVH